MMKFCLVILSMALLMTRLSASEPLVFESPEQQVRFTNLVEELRCLVCQNQSLADSDAPLAQDLREEIHQMLLAGSSNNEIKAFLVERYGDFVLYRPPVQGNTLALWLFPIALLIIGFIVVIVVIRRHNRHTEAQDLDVDS